MNVLRCKELCFLVPKANIGDNRQNMHALVTDVVTNGKHTEDKPKITYYAIDAPSMNEYMVTIRSEHDLPMCSAPISDRVIPVNAGSCMTLRLEISLQRDSSSYDKEIGKASRKREPQSVVPVYELESWIKGKMERAGFAVEQVKINSTSRRYVARKGAEFFIPSAVFILTGAIADSDKFSLAVLGGIGRNKGYGYGCIELVNV